MNFLKLTLNKNKMQVTKRFKAEGLVLGNLWGGGIGSYPSEVLIANTMEKLLNRANRQLEDGSLDSGMGFESLIGAVLNICIIRKIIFEERTYVNKSYEIVFIGDLTDEQKEYLNAMVAY